MRLLFSVSTLALVAFLLLGCGGGSGPETAEGHRGDGPPETTQKVRGGLPVTRSLTFTFSGLRGPESAGVVMADAHGYFVEVGLDSWVLSPATPARPITYVVDETDDVGVSHLPQVVLAREEGKPIVAIGSLIPKPTAALIWLRRSHIHGIADLKGRTIAIPGVPFQEALLETVLARAGLTLEDVTLKKVDYELLPRLVDGHADAIFGGTSNVEGIELESRGLHPVITPVSSLGIPPYEELVFIARADRVAREPRVFREFMRAVRRGTATAIEEPDVAAKMIVESLEANHDAGRKEMEAEVRATLPLLFGSGPMSPAAANRLVDWMHKERLIQGTPPTSAWLNNEFVR